MLHSITAARAGGLSNQECEMTERKIANLTAGLVLVAAALPALAQQAPAPQQPLMPPVEAAQPAEPKIGKGLVLMHEGRFFMTPCRDRSFFNLDDVSEGEAVFGALKEFGLAPGNNLYVEFYGVERGGLLEVSGINFARTRARCLGEVENDEAWRAVGLQSEWEAVAAGGTLSVTRVGAPEERVLYSAIVSDGAMHRIAGAGTSLEVTPGICRLADGSTMTGWKAVLKLKDGAPLQGCAWER